MTETIQNNIPPSQTGIIKRKAGRPPKIKPDQISQIQPQVVKDQEQRVLLEPKQLDIKSPEPILPIKEDIPTVVIPIEKHTDIIEKYIKTGISESIKNSKMSSGSISVKFSEPLKIEVTTSNAENNNISDKLTEIGERINKIREILIGKATVQEKPKKDHTKRNLLALFGVLIIILSVGFSGVTDHFSFVSKDNTKVNLTSPTTVPTSTPDITPNVAPSISINTSKYLLITVMGVIILIPLIFIIYYLLMRKNIPKE